MAKNIRIYPIGRLGNNMFQYLIARILQHHVPEAVISGLNLPQFGIETGAVATESADTHQIEILHHIFQFTKTAEALRRFDNVSVDIRWPCMRMEYFRRHLDLARRVFPINPALQTGFDESCLVINIRAEDVLKGVHPNYTLLPIAWYRHLIASCGLDPIFVGQLADDPYTSALRREFSTARFITFTNPFDDFNILRTSTNLVLGVSSFSWLAAWLSTSARRIVLPMVGFYNPLERPDVDLLPVHDRRYKFHLFQREHWTASADQLMAKINGQVDASALRALSWPRMFRAKTALKLAYTGRQPAGVSLVGELLAALARPRRSGY